MSQTVSFYRQMNENVTSVADINIIRFVIARLPSTTKTYLEWQKKKKKRVIIVTIVEAQNLVFYHTHF